MSTWILHHRYSDGSGSGVLPRVLSDQEKELIEAVTKVVGTVQDVEFAEVQQGAVELTDRMRSVPDPNFTRPRALHSIFDEGPHAVPLLRMEALPGENRPFYELPVQRQTFHWLQRAVQRRVTTTPQLIYEFAASPNGPPDWLLDNPDAIEDCRQALIARGKEADEPGRCRICGGCGLDGNPCLFPYRASCARDPSIPPAPPISRHF
jgi:hypothetical protein